MHIQLFQLFCTKHITTNWLKAKTYLFLGLRYYYDLIEVNHTRRVCELFYIISLNVQTNECKNTTENNFLVHSIHY